MVKYCSAGEATDDSMAYGTFHTGYLRLQTHTLKICNTNCFFSATMVAIMHLCYSMSLALLSNM